MQNFKYKIFVENLYIVFQSSQYACLNEQTNDSLIIKSKEYEDFYEKKQQNWENKLINDNKNSLDKRRSRPRFRHNSGIENLYPKYNPNILYMKELREKLPFARKKLRPTNLASKLYKNFEDEALDNTQTIEDDETDFLLHSPISYYYSDDELWVNTPSNTTKKKESTILPLSSSFRNVRGLERAYQKDQLENLTTFNK